MTSRSLVLAVCLSSSCAHDAGRPVERELGIVGRLIQARTLDRYRLRRGPTRNPLSISVDYTVDIEGARSHYEVSCATKRPECAVEGMPAIDTRKASRFAAELVAVWKLMENDSVCGGDAPVEIQRASRAGAAEFRVRGCGRERSYIVSCKEGRCSSNGGWSAIQDSARDARLRRLGVTYEPCFGDGIARMEPLAGGLDADQVTGRFNELWSAYRQVEGVRTAGLGPCCPTLEHGRPGWCLRLYLELKTRPKVPATTQFDAVVDAIAAKTPPAGLPRPPIVLYGYNPP